MVRSIGDVTAPHHIHSVRKALLSALVGQHIGTEPKQINLESTLEELGIDDEPHLLNELQKETKVLHLIKSVSGINHTAAAEGVMQKHATSFKGAIIRLYMCTLICKKFSLILFAKIFIFIPIISY